MLYIIKGDIGSGKTTYLANIAEKAILNKKRCFLIVPEQQTVSTERFMAERLPYSAPLYFEVSNFSRLTNTVFRKYGGISYRYSTQASRALIMWKTLEKLQNLLHEKKDEIEAGRVKKTLSALSELHACSVSPEMLMTAANETGEAALKEKLEDLSLISETYSQLLKEHYSDQNEDLDRLYELLCIHSFFEGAVVLVDSFTSFTTQEYKILCAIMKQCDLYVSLSLPKSNAERLCFEELLNCEKRLVKEASSNNIAIKKEDLGSSRRTQSPLINYVARNMTSPVCLSLPSYDGEKKEEGALRIVSCPDPYSEAEFVALDIKRRVQGGEKFKDFSIFARSASDYEGILDTALKKYDIPFFMSVRTDISAFAPIRMIYAAYAVCIRSFNRKDVITYMKCGLCGISDKDCDDFEIYTTKWNINGKRFIDGIDWNMNPLGYVDRRTDKTDEFLIRINETKSRLIEPLEALYDFCCEKHTVAEHCKMLFDFLKALSIEDRLYDLAQKAKEDGEVGDAELLLRLFPVICNSLDSLCEILSDTTLNAEQFVQLLRIVFAETDIGQIPNYLDTVTIGSADMLRSQCAHVYLFGVNDGEFPAAVNDSSFFSRGDRDLLSELGISLEQDLAERASRELFCIYRAFSSAEKSITLSYSNATLSYADSKPSHIIENIKHLAKDYAEIFSYTDMDELQKIWSKKASFQMLGGLSKPELKEALFDIFSEDAEYARRLQSVESPLIAENSRVSTDIMSSVYPSDIVVSPTLIEKYAKCQFSYFCRYIMQLEGHDDARINNLEIGTFVHAVLEKLFSYLHENGQRISDLDEKETNEAITEITSQYISELVPEGSEQTPRIKHLFSRLKESVLALTKNLQAEFSQSEFTPRYFEFNISEKNENLPSPIKFTAPDGTRISLRGKIDRVDTYEKDGNVYVRIVDYKTGNTSFSLKNLEYGLGMQMLVYLFSIWKTENETFRKSIGCKNDGEIIPAGVVYLNVDVKDSNVNAPSEEEINDAGKSKFKRNGLFLNDEGILRAMDKSLSSEYIPITLSKKGELSPKEALASLSEMGEHLKKLEEVIGNICTELKGGSMLATPNKIPTSLPPCKFCNAKAVCRMKIEEPKY